MANRADCTAEGIGPQIVDRLREAQKGYKAMILTSGTKSKLVLGIVLLLTSGCALYPGEQPCDMDTYAEMVFPNLQDMANTIEKIGAAQDAGDVEQVRQLRTQYLLCYNALELAPTTWCTQQMHQEFLISSNSYLNSVDMWLEGNLSAAASLLLDAGQHWNEGWDIYDRYEER